MRTAKTPAIEFRRDPMPPRDPVAWPSAGSAAVIALAYSRAAQARLPKVAQLYNAVVDVIADGRLEGGAKLPGERELSDACGISLGTAQKSLSMLSQDGQIVREHGRGSFIRSDRRPLHELWHYRFREPRTGALLPVYARVLERCRSHDDGPWASQIGRDPNGYVHIKRLIDVDGRFVCWSLMTLGATRFGALLDVPKAEIEKVNIKSLLHRDFDATTIAVRQTVRVATAPAAAAREAGWPGDRACLVLDVTALGRQMTSLSHQTIVVPSTEYPMEIGAEPDTPAPRGG